MFPLAYGRGVLSHHLEAGKGTTNHAGTIGEGEVEEERKRRSRKGAKLQGKRTEGSHEKLCRKVDATRAKRKSLFTRGVGREAEVYSVMKQGRWAMPVPSMKLGFSEKREDRGEDKSRRLNLCVTGGGEEVQQPGGGDVR